MATYSLRYGASEIGELRVVHDVKSDRDHRDRVWTQTGISARDDGQTEDLLGPLGGAANPSIQAVEKPGGQDAENEADEESDDEPNRVAREEWTASWC